MDGKFAVGVGNIYASESQFMAGIHPARSARRISAVRYEALLVAIRDVLDRAIRQSIDTVFYSIRSEVQILSPRPILQ